MDKLLERGILRVGIRVWPSAEFAPPAFRGFSNATTGGALNGFEVDIAWLLAEGLGLELELIEAYPPVIYSGDWRGQWDIALASLVPFDRPEGASTVTPLSFSQPYGYMPMSFITLPAGEEIQNLAQLSGRRIAVLEESAYEWLLISKELRLTGQNRPLLPDFPGDMEVVPVSNLAKAIDQLANDDTDDFDTIFGPAPIFHQAINSDLPLQLVIGPEILGKQPLAVALIPQDKLKVERLLTEINKVLERLQKQGTLAEIYLRWYNQDLSIE
jgi:ABC-type amino acid transport substrate-binding protein